MKEYRFEMRQEKIGTLHSITCDSCGAVAEYGKNQWEFQEFLKIRFTGGYGSIFGDMDTFECELCQKCVKEILGKYLRNVTEAQSHEG